MWQAIVKRLCAPGLHVGNTMFFRELIPISRILENSKFIEYFHESGM